MLKSFDIFPKVLQDQPLRKTQCGGSLFILTFSIILILIINEFYLTFILGELSVKPFVDTANMDERLRVNINITFHKVPCAALSLDLQDVTGTHLEDVKHTLHKLTLDQNGKYLDVLQATKIQQFERYINYPSNPLIRWYKKNTEDKEIVDCYGAQLYEGQKCITCQDVMSAYAAREWPQPPKEAIAQCMPDRKVHVKEIQATQGSLEEMLRAMDNNAQYSITIVKPQQADEKGSKRVIQQNIETREKLLGITPTQTQIETREQLLEITPTQLEPNEPQNLQKYSDLSLEEHTSQFVHKLHELQSLKTDKIKYSEKDSLDSLRQNQVHDLVDMMSISFEDFELKMKNRLNWEDKNKILFKKHLDQQIQKEVSYSITNLKRQFCTDELQIEMNLKLEADVHQFIFIVPPNQCEISLEYIVKSVDGTISIEIMIQDQTFQFNLKQEQQIQIQFELIKVESNKFTDLYDKPKRFFTFFISDDSQNQKRQLFTENFGENHRHSQQLLYMEDIAEIDKHTQEGCQIFGHFFIKKVPGNFRISFEGKGQAAMFLPQDFSVEHTINLLELTQEKEELSLGRIVGSTNSLDGTKQMNQKREDSQYYMKIVSGIINTLWSQEKGIYTYVAHEIKYQYNDQLNRKKTDSRLPSIIFKYEFDAVTMNYTSKYGSVSQLIVSILAIIGGVFAVSNLVSKILEKFGL